MSQDHDVSLHEKIKILRFYLTKSKKEHSDDKNRLTISLINANKGITNLNKKIFGKNKDIERLRGALHYAKSLMNNDQIEELNKSIEDNYGNLKIFKC